VKESQYFKQARRSPPMRHTWSPTRILFEKNLVFGDNLRARRGLGAASFRTKLSGKTITRRSKR
jgi:hypothetical protein